MRPFALVAWVFGVLTAAPSDAVTGREIALEGAAGVPACIVCHGASGEGRADLVSARLAGLDAGYILRQLERFADGSRKSATMEPVATALSEAGRKAVAAYYAALPIPVAAGEPVDASRAAAGAALARLGDWSRGLPGCGQCHGPAGSGVGTLVPRLAGQSAAYIEAQFEAWRSGARKGDPLDLMAGIAGKLDEAEIAAVAAFYAAAPNRLASRAAARGKADVRGGATRAGPFAPPGEEAITGNEFGRMVRLGENIFRDTQHYAAQYVGNTLTCQNCHLDGGRMADSAPLWAAFGNYPAYRSKNKHVNTYAERIQGCFRYSMNGEAPPLGSETLVALEAYSFFLARGAPVGIDLPGRGYPALPEPTKPFDYARGEEVYAENCALCHGANGEGQKSADGEPVFPALWGAESFNWGAGMGNIKNAAAFIKANMPFSQAGTLSDQDAWDVAAFVDSHERPQDPRFTGSVAETREQFHNAPTWMYGRKVNGVVLGEHSPPSGRR